MLDAWCHLMQTYWITFYTFFFFFRWWRVKALHIQCIKENSSHAWAHKKIQNCLYEMLDLIFFCFNDYCDLLGENRAFYFVSLNIPCSIFFKAKFKILKEKKKGFCWILCCQIKVFVVSYIFFHFAFVRQPCPMNFYD